MVLNVGDKITSKDGIYQKDQFHIMQEIVRDVPKEYRNIISDNLARYQDLVEVPEAPKEIEYRNMGHKKVKYSAN